VQNPTERNRSSEVLYRHICIEVASGGSGFFRPRSDFCRFFEPPASAASRAAPESAPIAKTLLTSFLRH
jgi:hypothetical protein